MNLHRLFVLGTLLLGSAASAQQRRAALPVALAPDRLELPQPEAPVTLLPLRSADASPRAARTQISAGVVEVSSTGGSTFGVYGTLKAAFDAINAGSHQGSITVTLLGNSVETASAVLNASGTGGALYASVRVQPSGHRSISGNINGVLVDLAGADNVTIDGINSADHSLTISNSNTGSAGTVRFISDASNNTLTNCILEGSSTGGLATASAVVICGQGTSTGNDNNTVSNNMIGPAGANQPLVGVTSYTGSTTIENNGFLVTGNRIYDVFHPTASHAAVYLGTGTNGASVLNNRIYQTASRTFTGNSTYIYGIYFTYSAGRADIKGNVIGFANATGTGTSTYNCTVSGGYRGIQIGSSRTTAPYTSVEGNQLSGLNVTSAKSATSINIGPFAGIDAGFTNVVTSPCDINNNTVGSVDGSSGISVTLTTFSNAGPVMGIMRYTNHSGGGISGNRIGNLQLNGVANMSTPLYGIFTYNNVAANTAAFTVSNNLISGLTSNLTGANSQLVGILYQGGTGTAAICTGNTVRDLKSLANTNGALNILGIVANLIPASSTVSDNHVYALSNNNGNANDALTAGVYLSGTGGILAERNRVSAIGAVGGTNKSIFGIIALGTNVEVRNSWISLGRDSSGTSISDLHIFALYSASPSSQLYHNSVYVSGTQTGGSPNSAALFTDGNVTNTVIKNNIFQNMRTGGAGKHPAVNYANGQIPASVDYNDLYVAPGSPIAVRNGTAYATLADYSAATGLDVHSISVDPRFVAPATTSAALDLHVAPDNGYLIAGTPVGVTTDYDGDARSTVTPTMGADELSCIAPTLSYVSAAACGSSATGLIDLTVTGNSMFTYQWTGPNGFMATTQDISGLVQGDYSVLVTANGGCTATAGPIRIGSGINPPANQVLCAGATSTAVPLPGVAGSTYSWTNDNPAIGLPASGTGDVPSFMAMNAGTTPETAVITVTGSGATGCPFKPSVFRITVKPQPVMNKPGSQELCAGSSAAPVAFSSNLPGTLFSWVNNNVAIGLNAYGTGSIPSFMAQNNSGSTQVATVQVTPVADRCAGAPLNYTYTVYPSAGTIAYPNAGYCQSGTALPERAGSTGGSFSASPAGLSINAATGALNLAQSQPGTYTVAYTATSGGGCIAVAETIVTVYSPATVDAPANPVYCSGRMTQPIVFTGSASSFTWTNDNTSIGLPASGSGSIQPFMAMNAGATPQYATIRVTPVGAGGCPGKTRAFRITVSPCGPVTLHGDTEGDGSTARLAPRVTLSPNPAQSSVQVRYSGTGRLLTVEVRNAYGQVAIAPRAFTGSPLPVGTLVPGTYYVVITDRSTGARAQQLLVKL